MIDDIELRRNVENELAWEPSIDSRDIGVAVKDGVVTLTGQVSQFNEKMEAQDLAKRISGVRGVANDIEVHPPGSFQKSDTDIARAAANALDSNSTVPEGRVRPIVKHGVVTLEGDLEWHYQKMAAASTVRYLAGVKGVSNMIKIKPSISPEEIERKIESAFQRHAVLDARRIKIETSGAEVTLSGIVHSWVEREQAQEAAWKAPGVAKVNNRLSVSVSA